jgi:alkylation response protein AidB-like acyl-CoA dehydrogenase
VGAIESGRSDLERWRRSQVPNYFTSAPHLRALVVGHVGEQRWSLVEPRLREFGQVVATEIEPAVATLEERRNAPILTSYDRLGRHVERIDFHPLYGAVGRAVWASGLLSCNTGGDAAVEQAAMFYLLSHAGEGGHACPAVCTTGLARALERRGPMSLAARYLPGLTESDYDRCLRGSQFLTEVQGGSDVGANATAAARDGAEPGAWRITGEKWFCSVADADLFAVTARPSGAVRGTRGLGCFLVPRTLDGERPNGFRIRRLKDKLGTRCMASGEIDFTDALGWPIGTVEQGFHVAVEELLNTSRWLNAVGSTGLMHRAYVEALTFATHRTAFGRPIFEFHAVRDTLASMRADEHGALASTLELTRLRERIDAEAADDDEVAAHRVLVNANKFVTSITATDVVHRGVEILGGNGTIEDFSCLPRLYRDSVVYESWEGTHNVLCAQISRDLGGGEVADGLFAWVRRLVEDSGLPLARSVLGDVERSIRSTAATEEGGLVTLRRDVIQLVRLVQAASVARSLRSPSGEQTSLMLLDARASTEPGRSIVRRELLESDLEAMGAARPEGGG